VHDSTTSRLIVAAPVSLLASMLLIVAVAPVSNDVPLAGLAGLILAPTLCAVWLFADWSWPEKSGMVLSVVGITAVTYVAVITWFSAVFEGEGYLHPDGWYGVWASLAVLLIGSLILRVRLSEPVPGPWLLWYLPVIVAVVWAAMTNGSQSDPTDTTLLGLAYELTSLGLCTWVGLLAARRIGRGLKWGPRRVT